jgi:hypothetical protein
MEKPGIKENLWGGFSVLKEDVRFIYNLLLEKAAPLPSDEILMELVQSRIEREMRAIEESRTENGEIYYPKEEFQVGDKLVFPAVNDQAGQVTAVRAGFNPEYPDFQVIDVQLNSGQKMAFAGKLAEHPLNEVPALGEEDPDFNPEIVMASYGADLQAVLDEALLKSEDLVRIAGAWFPRSLLVDISVGHLNLAEAVLEEKDGGPITTPALMQQLELDLDADPQLVEFSLNLAMDEDKRFDEVGPAGVTLWFLHEKEPDDIRETPIYLRYSPPEQPMPLNDELIGLFKDNLYDELEEWDSSDESANSICISLSFPHWRAGTLPLSKSLRAMFPTSYEAPRIQFTFVDAQDGKTFDGWVARPQKYISGLGDWYRRNDLMPGSLVTVEPTDIPGQIRISFEKSRQNKEWLKTVLVGTDQGVVFAMLKHPIAASFNDRMAIAVPDAEAIDGLWTARAYQKEPFEKTILRIMRELAKLNPQGQVHAQELYAAVNVVRRCPPGLVLYTLLESERVNHLGDLYFTLKEKE